MASEKEARVVERERERETKRMVEEVETKNDGNQFLGRYSNQGRTISFPRGNATDKYTCGSSSFYRCARLVTGNSRVHVCFLLPSCAARSVRRPRDNFLIILCWRSSSLLSALIAKLSFEASWEKRDFSLFFFLFCFLGKREILVRTEWSWEQSRETLCFWTFFFFFRFQRDFKFHEITNG